MKTKNTVKLSVLIGSALLFCNSLHASSQPNHPTSSISVADSTPLSAFEGFYQFPNQVAYIEFIVEGNELIAKQTWDSRQYKLKRNADLNFTSVDEGYVIEFHLSNKMIVGAKILNRVELVKVDFNPDAYIRLDDGAMRKYEGKYELTRNKEMHLELRVKDGGLSLKQLWDNKVIQFSPKTANFFYNDELTFPISFEEKENQKMQMRAFENDVWLRIN
ncbi:hypothetical protein [Sphingobacterium hungaricum]|uniref:DUF3108 domain-containing protein n=1 Tax=Sphingobacterium hungaricum TaxID=2082723 RepID=A0A928YNR1_9SPHI|nr:hypothetical protein [Sphingobacterium hungaricum]MBE8712154.1 hypothetical protein [Sphingobacterium hungaricum]